MPNFLVFQLYGVMASWGEIAVGEHRHSLGHPTKSAITGLLAAALGIEREEEAMHNRFSEQYSVAICVRTAGELLRDYHTVQVPGGKREYASRREELNFDVSNLNTILSQRDYRTDSFYQIAIWCNGSDAPFPLELLREKLQRPVFTLYLGRKSCPVSLPLCPVVFSGVSLKQAFNNYSLQEAATWTDKLSFSKLVSYFWEQGTLSAEALGMNPSMSYPRRDKIGSRKRWQFANRDEFYYAEARLETTAGGS